MRTVTTDSTLLLHTRADVGGDIIGTGYGMAVPYGVEIEFDGMMESFAPGAFDTAAVVGKPLAYRHNEPIGVITAATNEADGLYIDFDVVNTSLGRDAATLMRTGSSRGLSVGFAPLESKRTQGKNAIVYTKAALAEVSLTHQPAYSSAGVGSIREDHMSTETVEDAAPAVVADISAREAIEELRREVQSVVHVAEPVHPLAQFRSYGEYSKAVLEGFESRALFDQVTGDNPGVFPPVWLQQVRGIIDLGRPVITGVGGPQSAGTTGLDINWPYFDSATSPRLWRRRQTRRTKSTASRSASRRAPRASAPTQPVRISPISCSSGRSRRTSTRTTASWRRPTPRSPTANSPVTCGTLEPAP
jgi:HK97 family phage prohead protease